MSSPKKAVIVAAGKSSRLYPLTLDTPKALLKVAGEPILVRSIRLLRECGVEKIAVVVGFHRDKIERQLGEENITFLYNPFFATTNNLASLFCAKEWVSGQDFVYLHGDIVYDPELFRLMLNPGKHTCCSLLVAMGPTDDEAMKVRLVSGRFVESSKSIAISEAVGEWIGIAYFSAASVASLFDTVERVLEDQRFNAYDTEAFTRMAGDGIAFDAIPTGKWRWIEVDYPEDLEVARKIFPE